jgi:hypothetical protein
METENTKRKHAGKPATPEVAVKPDGKAAPR